MTDIIIPIYNAYDYVQKCIETVILHTDLKRHGLILINDKSSDTRIKPLLDDFKAQHPTLNIKVIHNQSNLGFVKNVNLGLTTSTQDVVLLNSDTEVTSGWIDKLEACAYSKDCVATVTPLSNNATLASVPDFLVENQLPSHLSLDEYAAIIEKSSMKLYPEIPTAHGFCMFIRREAINLVGLFDDVLFAKGYGEENDFCYRCIKIGYRHLLCDDTYIYHKGTQSFKEEKKVLIDEHLKLIEDKYPDCVHNTNKFLENNPIRPIQLNAFYASELYSRPNILVAVHTYQDPPVGNFGGTSMHVYDIVKTLNEYFNFHVLYYSERDREYHVTSYLRDKVITNTIGKFPRYTMFNLYNDAFKEYVKKIVSILRIELVHIHHLIHLYLDLVDVVSQQDIPIVFSLHDYYMVCPSINLMDHHNRPCHLLEQRDCATCTAERYHCHGQLITLWQKHFHSMLKRSQMIITPSETAKRIIQQFYNDLEIKVIEHGSQHRQQSNLVMPERKKDKMYHVAFIGGISQIKGLDYLKELIKIVKGSDIMIHLFGVTPESMYNVNAPNYLYHGEYDRQQLPTLIQRNNIKLICLFSIWAETFSYTLSESLLLGIPVLTIDIGATAERVKRSDTGWVLPYGCDVKQVLDTIIKIRNEWATEYTAKLNQVKRYIKSSKSIQEMGQEYNSIYQELLNASHYNAPTAGNTQDKLVFYQTIVPSVLMGEDNVFTVEKEYRYLKNVIFKSDMPISLVIRKLKTFRNNATGTKLRNKIVLKFLWYRILQRQLKKLTVIIRK